jgi:hypothetical protein
MTRAKARGADGLAGMAWVRTMLWLTVDGLRPSWEVNDVHRRARRQDGDRENWRGNLADQAIRRIEARRVLLLLSKIVIPVE